MFSCTIHITDRYKTQQMRDRIISEDPFSIFYCPDKYNTQRMCGEAVDKCLAALKFIPDWFGTNNMLEKLLLLYTLMKLCFFIMKILIKFQSLFVKGIFLLQILNLS